MKKRIQNKIHHLRRQPQHVRFRAASMITLLGGGLLVVVWLSLLLPLQLRFAPGGSSLGDGQEPTPAPRTPDSDSGEVGPAPQVGGAFDDNLDASPSRNPIFVQPGSDHPPASPSPTLAPSPEPEAGTQPVNITE